MGKVAENFVVDGTISRKVHRNAIFKTISRIRKNFFFAERYGRWLLFSDILVLKYATNFPTLQLFQYPENVKISIFPTSQFFPYTVPKTFFWQKCYIFKSISNIRICPKNAIFFTAFFLLKDMERWGILALWLNFSFCPAGWKFQKRFFGAQILWLKISSAQIFFCNSNVTTFQHPNLNPEKCKNFNFGRWPNLHCPRKCQNLNFSLYTAAEMLYLQK